MLVKKQIQALDPVPAYMQELEYLYGRRLVIDTLIDSLEQYDRYRAIAPNESKLTPA
jgi:hypothetical protein